MNEKPSPPQQLQPSVLRVALLDDTYGVVQHVKDLQKADLNSDADALHAAPSEPKQLQVRQLANTSLAASCSKSSICWDVARAICCICIEDIVGGAPVSDLPVMLLVAQML